MIAGLIKILFAAVGLVGVIGGLIILTGAYNVAATEPHYAMTISLFSTARDHAIAARTKGITPPSGWPERTDLKEEFRNYHEMCVMCHAAPGLEDSVVRTGLNPEPPKLTVARVQGRTDADLFWIIKNGIKMTGMPAFGPTHTDEEIWNLVAFLRGLKTMQPTEYKDLLEQADGSTRLIPSDHHHPSRDSH